ncbi:MAG: hypothetical protein GX643_04040 [Acidimicrobiales bacterium]|nr:hypothetical protein [Acidimicrobiales bacterium]
MIRTRATRRLLAVLTAALVTFALSACDPTPVMLSGTVTFDDSGSPAGGTVVSVLTVGGTQVASQTTGVEGTFRFHESVLPAGEYLVAFGTQLTEFWEDTTDDGSPTTVTVSAEEPATIAASIAPSGIGGTITADGSPVAGAEVTVRPDTGDLVVATAITGTDGTYELGVGDGTFHLMVETAGLATAVRSVVVHPNANPVIDVALDPEVPLTGVLYDGGPVHPATVVARSGGMGIASTETGPNGSFTMGGLGTQPVGLTVIRGTSRIDLPGTYSGDAGLIILSEASCTHPGALAYANLSGQDLSGADLRGCDLNHADLTGADLTNALLSFADLSNAILVNANLTGTTLVGANLAGSNLFGATIQDADLSHATLTGASSGGITGTPAVLPDRWALVQGALVGPGVRLPWAGFAGSDLSGLDLTDADLTSADLRGANLNGTQLTGANLQGADLTGANLTNATLAGSNLTNTNVTNATLIGIRSGGLTSAPLGLPSAWGLTNGYLVGPGAGLSGANLSGAYLFNRDLTGANLTGANLAQANLSVAYLSQATLDGADLRGANVSLADLTDATVTGASLQGADLNGAVLVRTDMTGADLTGADLSTSYMTDTILSGATLQGVISRVITGTPSALPAPWVLANRALLGPGASVAYGNFTGLSLRNVDLTGAELSNSTFTDADLTGANLTDAVLESPNLDGTNLSGATLTRVTVTDGILTGTNLIGANLDGAALGGSDLTGANLMAASATNADLTGADLSGAWLIGTVLTGSNLTSTTLAGTWLGGAVLDDTTSSGIIGVPATLPAGWVLTDGSLVFTG